MTDKDQIFRDGIDWLARNAGSTVEVTDAVRLLGYLADTTDEIILQAAWHRKNQIVAERFATEHAR